MERSSSNYITSQYLNADRNRFTYLIILAGSTFLEKQLFKPDYKKFFDEALERSSQNMQRARVEWDWLVDTFFTQMGRPVPDWPIYREIQQGFGIYDNSFRQRLALGLKSKINRVLWRAFEVIHRRCTSWTWAAERRCYHFAALWKTYVFPSGDYSCLME
jgi:hypothetical protein